MFLLILDNMIAFIIIIVAVVVLVIVFTRNNQNEQDFTYTPEESVRTSIPTKTIEDWFNIDIHDIFKYSPRCISSEVSEDSDQEIEYYLLKLEQPELDIFDSVQVIYFRKDKNYTLKFKARNTTSIRKFINFINDLARMYGPDSLGNRGFSDDEEARFRSGYSFSRMWKSVWADNMGGYLKLTLYHLHNNAEEPPIPQNFTKAPIPNSVWGIKFGTSKEDAEVVLKSKVDIEITSIRSSNNKIIVQTPTFAGYLCDDIEFGFVDNLFFASTITILPFDDRGNDYCKLWDDLNDKYGQGTSLCNGSMNIWSDRKHTISLSSSESVIRLCYMNDKLMKQHVEQTKIDPLDEL